MADIPKDTLEDACQLVKHNSIQVCSAVRCGALVWGAVWQGGVREGGARWVGQAGGRGRSS